MLAYALTSLLITLVSVAALTILFDVHVGNIFLVIFLTFATSLVSTALGILISSITYSIAESVQIAAMLFLAIMISTQFLFHTESMHPIVKYISMSIPFTYTIRSMREINILNLGFVEVYKTFIILFVFFIVLLLFSTILLKRKSD
jgi:ABC-type polysaccharide/polyol phosphate export permease